jgi:hypothetical protein
MAYSIKQWFDHVVQYPNRFTYTPNGDGTTTETPAPGEIIQQGTPQSAANFNNNEHGTFAANEMADFLVIQTLQLQRELMSQTLQLRNELMSQTLQLRHETLSDIGTITLTNTQVFPFNNSGSTVALQTLRDTTDYIVTVEVQSVAGGAAGDITISNKLRNGFQLSFDGSASQVVVRYNVTGGNV